MKALKRDNTSLRIVTSDDKETVLGAIGMVVDFISMGIIEAEQYCPDNWMYIDYPFLCEAETRDEIIQRVHGRYPQY